MVLNIAFTVFWIFSWLGVYSVGMQYNNDTFIILTYLWYVIGVFWGFFLFYSMVFLVASACAYWYYQSEDNSVLRGINNIKYHLGSICFGSIVITIVTVLRMMASAQKGKGEGIAGLVACLA